MYPTPSTLPADTVCRVLRIPNDLNYLMAVDELLSRLGIESYWEQSPGGIPPELAAARAARMFKEYLDEECTLSNTLKFSISPGQQDDAAVATYDFTDYLVSGSRIFPANYGFGEGSILSGEFMFRAATEEASRDYTFRPQLGGTNLAIIPVTIPEGYKVFKLNIDLTATGTQQVSAIVQGVVRLTEYTEAGAILAHHVRYGFATINQTQAHNFNLFGGWSGAPGGAESTVGPRYGYLEIKRVE